jgi:hypothetical protein
VISRSDSDWRLKPSGEIRLVSNFRMTWWKKIPIRDVIRATSGSEWFTVIDLKEGFYHIEMDKFWIRWSCI